jgi:hypothetical protein
MALPVNSQFGIKKETTWATAVTPDRFLEFDGDSLNLEQEYHDGISLRADTTFESSARTKKLRRAAGGAIPLPVGYKQFGVILDQAVTGTVTPSVVSGTAYLSTFNVGLGAAPTKSATLQINKPYSTGTDLSVTYPGAMLSGMSFSIDTDGILMCNTTWDAQDETTPGTTPAGAALASASYAAGQDVWPETTAALTLNGGDAGAVTGISWEWQIPRANRRKKLDGSSTYRQPVVNGKATVTGSLQVDWESSTYYDLFRSGAFASLVLTCTGPTAITGAVYPTFQVTFAAIQIRGGSPSVNGPDLISTSVPFVAKFDGTNAPMKIEYTSTDSTAW